jgi:hypothetical protein
MFVEYKLVAAITNLGGLYGAQMGGLVITAMNCIVPASLSFLSTIFEIHEQEQQAIASAYNKIAFFRYFNTSVIIYLITPFDEFLTFETLFKVQSILLFDACFTPMLYQVQSINRLHYYIMTPSSPRCCTSGT